MLTHLDALRLFAIGLPSQQMCAFLTALVCIAAGSAVLIVFIGRHSD